MMHEGMLADQIDVAAFAAAADAISSVAGARLACLVFQAENGDFYLAPHPIYATQVLRAMSYMDWDNALRQSEEFTY